MHPLRCGLSHILFEGGIKCAVTAEATLIGQLLDGYRLMGSDGFMVEVDKMLNAQTVDVCIICDTMQGEMFAEVGAVDSNQCGKL